MSEQDTAALVETEQVTEHVEQINVEQAADPNAAGAEQASTEPVKPTGPTPEELAALAQAFVARIGSPTKSTDPDNPAILWAQGVGVMGGEDRDATTGAIPDGVINNLKAEFHKLPSGAARKAVRDWAEQVITDAMDAYDIKTARSMHAIKRHVLTGSAPAAPTAAAKPVDPTEEHVNKVVALYLAPYMVVVPEGVSADWGKQVEDKAAELTEAAGTYARWQDASAALAAKGDEATDADRAALGTEPEVPEVIKTAFRLARGRVGSAGGAKRAKAAGTGGTKAASTGDGVRRNVGNHISSAFADKPVGTFLKIAEIVNTRSEEYGDNPVSPGAVSARLFPPSGGPCTVPGIVGEVGPDGNKGGRKVS